jgi:hypothetical protein
MLKVKWHFFILIFIAQLTQYNFAYANAPLNKKLGCTCNFHTNPKRVKVDLKKTVNNTQDFNNDNREAGDNNLIHSKVYIYHHRLNYSTPVLPSVLNFQFYSLSVPHPQYSIVSIRRAILPAYYNFLFRLSPF